MADNYFESDRYKELSAYQKMVNKNPMLKIKHIKGGKYYIFNNETHSLLKTCDEYDCKQFLNASNRKYLVYFVEPRMYENEYYSYEVELKYGHMQRIVDRKFMNLE